MYQLLIFFMITNPKTTVRSRMGQCIVAVAIAAFEFVLRLSSSIYAPLYSLFWRDRMTSPPAFAASSE